MRIKLEDLYLPILINNNGNVDGMKSNAMAHRDHFLNEKAEELKRELEKDTAVVTVVIAAAVSSLHIPGSGALLLVCYMMKKFRHVAKEMGLVAGRKAVASTGFTTWASETYNEVIDQIKEEMLNMLNVAVPVLSLLKIPSTLAAYRQRVIIMIDTLHEKAKLRHEVWIDNQISLLLVSVWKVKGRFFH
jgi:hypothetical protein